MAIGNFWRRLNPWDRRATVLFGDESINEHIRRGEGEIFGSTDAAGNDIDVRNGIEYINGVPQDTRSEIEKSVDTAIGDTDPFIDDPGNVSDQPTQPVAPGEPQVSLDPFGNEGGIGTQPGDTQQGGEPQQQEYTYQEPAGSNEIITQDYEYVGHDYIIEPRFIDNPTGMTYGLDEYLDILAARKGSPITRVLSGNQRLYVYFADGSSTQKIADSPGVVAEEPPIEEPPIEEPPIEEPPISEPAAPVTFEQDGITYEYNPETGEITEVGQVEGYQEDPYSLEYGGETYTEDDLISFLEQQDQPILIDYEGNEYTVDEFVSMLDDAFSNIGGLEDDLEYQEAQNAAANQRISDLEQRLINGQADYADLQAEADALGMTVEDLEQRLAERDAEIEGYVQEISQGTATIESLQELADSRGQTIEQLQADLEQKLSELSDAESTIQGYTGVSDAITTLVNNINENLGSTPGQVSPVPNETVQQAYEDGTVMDLNFIQESNVPLTSLPGSYMKVPGGGNLYYKFFDQNFGTPALAGKPMALVRVNEDGSQTVIRDFLTQGQNLANIASSTDQLRNFNFTDWMSDQGLDFNDEEIADVWNEDLAPLQGVREAMMFPDASEENRAIYDDIQGDAREYASGLMGMNPTEFNQQMESLIEGQMAGPGSMQGFSNAERQLRERANRGTVREAEERYGRLINNVMASTGSSSRAMMQADMYARQINDFQLQQNVSMAQEEYERQLDQFEGQRQMLDRMLQTNQIGQQQYYERLERNYSQAWDGYMDKIGIMLQQNQEYLTRYSQDWQALTASVEASYKALNAELGMEEAVYTQMQDIFEMNLAPTFAKLEMLTTEASIQAMEEAARQGDWGILMDTLGTVVEIGTAVAGFFG